jgi:hypothetical protein
LLDVREPQARESGHRADAEQGEIGHRVLRERQDADRKRCEESPAVIAGHEDKLLGRSLRADSGDEGSIADGSTGREAEQCGQGVERAAHEHPLAPARARQIHERESQPGVFHDRAEAVHLV